MKKNKPIVSQVSSNLFLYKVYRRTGKHTNQGHAVQAGEVHVMDETQVTDIVEAAYIDELRTGKVSIFTVPLKNVFMDGLDGEYMEIWYANPSAITCKRCHYNVYGLTPQWNRMRGRGHYGHLVIKETENANGN